MNDSVSRWIDVVLLVASTSVVCGIFIPGLPWAGFLWLSLALSVSLWMLSRESTRSTAQVIWDLEAEPVRAVLKGHKGSGMP